MLELLLELLDDFEEDEEELKLLELLEEKLLLDKLLELEE
jgi:hypothetical protein